MDATPTPGPAADPSAAPAPLQPRKIYFNHDTGLFGYRCRVCPDARQGGFDTASDAAEAYNRHALRPRHQQHEAARAEVDTDG